MSLIDTQTSAALLNPVTGVPVRLPNARVVHARVV